MRDIESKRMRETEKEIERLRDFEKRMGEIREREKDREKEGTGEKNDHVALFVLPIKHIELN